MISSLSELLGLGKKQNKGVKQSDVKKLYERELPSFVDLLPYTGYDADSGTFILEDGFSRAKVFTIEPLPTEGRGLKTIINYRDKMKEFIEQTFQELQPEQGQWVIQQFSYDDPRIDLLADQIADYCKPHAKDTEFTKEYIKEMRRHLKGVSKNTEGIFFDDEVTNAPWIGRYRRMKLVVYRRCTNGNLRDREFCPAEEINEVMEMGTKILENGGYKIKEDNAKEFFSWLVRIFNPSPEMENPEDFYRLYEDIIAREAEGELPIKGALCESLVANAPRSSVEDNCWYFDETPSRFIRIAGSRRPPRIGQLTGEVSEGEGENQTSECTLDKLPPNSILASTTIICPQNSFENLLLKQSEKAYGSGMAADRKQEDIANAASAMGRNDSIVRNFSGVYIRAKTKIELRKKSQQAFTVLSSCGLKPLKDNVDSYALRAYLLSLPMFFNPKNDAKFTYIKPTWAQHVANLSFAYGRDEGTGNPNFTWFNRGGSPLMVDPLNKNDRASNTFGLVLGAPGSGKSATACALAVQMAAVHRPKMFIVEKGNSFGLVGDYMERYGMKVARMTFSPESKTTLSLFDDAMKLLQEDEELLMQQVGNVGDMSGVFESKVDLEDLEKPDEDVSRDIIGELELIAMLMITGGEPKEAELYRRADRQVLRKAIVHSATLATRAKQKCLPRHIYQALNEIGEGIHGSFSDARRKVASDMALSLEMWCEEGSFVSRVFNSPEGDAIPDADVVIIDVGSFADEGNEAELAVLMTGIFQYVTRIAEAEQYTGHGIAFFIDEAHLLTVNPLLAPYIIKMVKMYRKLGVHPWFITQNITDFPNESEKLLTMMEWYIVMLASPAEVEKISKYKSLTEDQVNMIVSSKKADRKFTEGVVLSKKVQSLFRAVPPSLYLTLAMTEKEEKEERYKVMQELKAAGLPCTGLDAAVEQAKRLDKARKIAA
ncbi:conjugative transfer ATPase [Vibrio sp. S11_S32]|uniref:conjugative transfer ATPase n=1 Tax=Vibrio sp. S11_S32 TaxID=2720225 RepID=UPI0016801EE3|nr:conjugative transfer ATPase [Vibrio sp. S11_S32]MBD1577108.1 conjugative transfer ATPase [Vibrio sp. S11_S32]